MNNYYKEVEIHTEGIKGEPLADKLYITDDVKRAEELRAMDCAVIEYLNDNSRDKIFPGVWFAVEDPEMPYEYYESVYKRYKRLPWTIAVTDRIILRETSEDDVDAFFEIYSDPDVTKYTQNLLPTKIEEQHYISDYVDKVYRFYGYGIWTVVLKETGKIIGKAGITNREGFADPEIGFVIGKEWQHKGYAYEACKAAIDYIIEEYGFRRIRALVRPQNEASIGLLKKLGFSEYGEYELEGEKNLQFEAFFE